MLTINTTCLYSISLEAKQGEDKQPLVFIQLILKCSDMSVGLTQMLEQEAGWGLQVLSQGEYKCRNCFAPVLA